jgi:hypothetical protein
MAPEHTHYERVSVDGNSRAHLGHSFSRSCASTQPCEAVYLPDRAELIRCTDTTLEARNDGESRIANQVSQLTIHGDQHIHKWDLSRSDSAIALQELALPATNVLRTLPA